MSTGGQPRTWIHSLRRLKQRKIENDNFKMDLQKLGCVGVGLIELIQDCDKWQAVVKMAISIRVP